MCFCLYTNTRRFTLLHTKCDRFHRDIRLENTLLTTDNEHNYQMTIDLVEWQKLGVNILPESAGTNHIV